MNFPFHYVRERKLPGPPKFFCETMKNDLPGDPFWAPLGYDYELIMVAGGNLADPGELAVFAHQWAYLTSEIFVSAAYLAKSDPLTMFFDPSRKDSGAYLLYPKSASKQEIAGWCKETKQAMELSWRCVESWLRKGGPYPRPDCPAPKRKWSGATWSSDANVFERLLGYPMPGTPAKKGDKVNWSDMSSSFQFIAQKRLDMRDRYDQELDDDALQLTEIQQRMAMPCQCKRTGKARPKNLRKYGMGFSVRLLIGGDIWPDGDPGEQLPMFVEELGHIFGRMLHSRLRLAYFWAQEGMFRRRIGYVFDPKKPSAVLLEAPKNATSTECNRMCALVGYYFAVALSAGYWREESLRLADETRRYGYGFIERSFGGRRRLRHAYEGFSIGPKGTTFFTREKYFHEMDTQVERFSKKHHPDWLPPWVTGEPVEAEDNPEG